MKKSADEINVLYKKFNGRMKDREQLVEWLLNRYRDNSDLQFDWDNNEFFDDDRSGTYPCMDGFNQ